MTSHRMRPLAIVAAIASLAGTTFGYTWVTTPANTTPSVKNVAQPISFSATCTPAALESFCTGGNTVYAPTAGSMQTAVITGAAPTVNGSTGVATWSGTLTYAPQLTTKSQVTLTFTAQTMSGTTQNKATTFEVQ